MKKQVIQVLLGLCIIGMIVFLGLYIKSIYTYKTAQSVYKDIQDISTIEPVAINVNKENMQDDIAVNFDLNDKHLDPIAFDLLKQVNEDIIGWIVIPNTRVNYPIVQTGNNDFYLTHLANGDESQSGSIFMDSDNTFDFTDKNTRLYGHHMKDGSMFASLMAYKDQAYYEEHPMMYLYTPNHIYEVQFFAGCLVDGSNKRNVPITFSTPEDFDVFIQNTHIQSSFKSDIEVTQEDTIVSLVTCDYDFYDARYVLYGRIEVIE